MKRYWAIYVKKGPAHSAEKVIKEFYRICQRHLYNPKKRTSDELYRVFYYDCKPFDKRIHHPITNRMIDFGKSDVATFQNEFLAQLRKSRKVALRLGYLNDPKRWVINPRRTKDLLKGKIEVHDLEERDVRYQLNQKGVDIKIGIDIASLAFKKLVDKIILISGDGDFVPAAKLARREGIDFILDPMWNPIDDSLFEHIDGLSSGVTRPEHWNG
ncbi:MAG: NYN domain-containing protein [Bacteroidota bacterium]